MRSTPVHPRMRGEHSSHSQSAGWVSGSSPHARGTHVLAKKRVPEPRFIPACAGNTSAGTPARRKAPVHPRMRGEHLGCQGWVAHSGGSSPHARGTRGADRAALGRLRFIPACAGNTRAASSTACRPSVHPRMRGEHGSICMPPSRSPGSSPHARGTLGAERIGSESRRFIPACAGNTLSPTEKRSPLPVHPRMRGEHGPEEMKQASASGSSPHARGTRVSGDRCSADGRFIPACAGNTVRQPARNAVHAVHPRMRGEHIRPDYDPTTLAGSSPHARGTPRHLRPQRLPQRFIPACAGNT